MVDAGYDPRQATRMFETLARLGGGGRLPEWQSTHPDPVNRAAASAQRVATMTVDPATLRTGREAYLRRIDGMVFGDNPREGFFDGDVYHHPDLRFRLAFPAGWQRQNLSQAVIGVSPGEDAVLQVTLSPYGTPRVAADSFFVEAGVRQESSSSASINGLAADTRYFSVSTQQGVIDGLVAFVAYGGNVYQLLGYATRSAFTAARPLLAGSIASFREESDPAVLAVQPATVSLVRVPRTMSVAAFHRQYPSTIPLEQVALINGVDVDGTLSGGTLVKRVTGGRP